MFMQHIRRIHLMDKGEGGDHQWRSEYTGKYSKLTGGSGLLIG